MCCSVIQMFTRLSNSANRTILYDLYPYIWDIKSIISMVKSFVQWLGMYEGNLKALTLRELYSSIAISLIKSGNPDFHYSQTHTLTNK